MFKIGYQLVIRRSQHSDGMLPIRFVLKIVNGLMGYEQCHYANYVENALLSNVSARAITMVSKLIIDLFKAV